LISPFLSIFPRPQPYVSSDRRSILIAKALSPSSVEPTITSVELEAVKTRSIMQAQAALAFAPEAIEIALAESRIDTLNATERTMLRLKEVRYYGLRRTLERALEGTVPSWLWTPGSFRDYPHRFIHPITHKISEIPPNIRYEPIWV
jgi:hypothetical protein